MPPKRNNQLTKDVRAAKKTAAPRQRRSGPTSTKKPYAPSVQSVKKSVIGPDVEIRNIFKESLVLENDLHAYIENELEDLQRTSRKKKIFPRSQILAIKKILNLLSLDSELRDFVTEALKSEQSIVDFSDMFLHKPEIQDKLRKFEDMEEGLEKEKEDQEMKDLEKALKETMKKVRHQIPEEDLENIDVSDDEEDIVIETKSEEFFEIGRKVRVPDPVGKVGTFVKGTIIEVDIDSKQYQVAIDDGSIIFVPFSETQENIFAPAPRKLREGINVVGGRPAIKMIEETGTATPLGPMKSLIKQSSESGEKKLPVQINKQKIVQFKKADWLNNNLDTIYVSPSHPYIFPYLEIFINKDFPAISDPYLLDDGEVEFIEDYEEAKARMEDDEKIYFQINDRFFYLYFSTKKKQNDLIFQSKDHVGNDLTMFIIFLTKDGQYIQQNEEIFKKQIESFKNSSKDICSFLDTKSKDIVDKELFNLCLNLISNSLIKIAPDIHEYYPQHPYMQDLMQEIKLNSDKSLSPTLDFVDYVAQLIFYIREENAHIFHERLRYGFYLPAILAKLPMSEKFTQDSLTANAFTPFPEGISSEMNVYIIKERTQEIRSQICSMYYASKIPGASKKTVLMKPRISSLSTTEIKKYCVNSKNKAIESSKDHDLVLYFDEEIEQWYCLRIEEDLLSQFEHPNVSQEGVWVIKINQTQSKTLNLIARGLDIPISAETKVNELLDEAAIKAKINTKNKSYIDIYFELTKLLNITVDIDDPPTIEYEHIYSLDETQTSKPIINPYSGSIMSNAFIEKFKQQFLYRIEKKQKAFLTTPTPSPAVVTTSTPLEPILEDTVVDDRSHLISALLVGLSDLSLKPTSNDQVANELDVASISTIEDDASTAGSTVSSVSTGTERTISENIEKKSSIDVSNSSVCFYCKKTIDKDKPSVIKTINAEDNYEIVYFCDAKCLSDTDKLDEYNEKLKRRNRNEN
mgnify:CR=1 FL=1|tara:strand:- start:1276 stop:4191 length:2916 start_codon:yes stop_codon:yes gene_type:complete